MRTRALLAILASLLPATLGLWLAVSGAGMAQSGGTFGSAINQGDNLSLGFNNPLLGQENPLLGQQDNPLRQTAVVPCSLEFTAEQEIGERQTYMSLCEGFSTTLSSDETFETVIVGDDEIVSVAVINSQMLSITGVETGATNVQFFTRRGDLVKIVTINVVNRPDFTLNPVAVANPALSPLSTVAPFETQFSGQATTPSSAGGPLLNNLTSFLGGLKSLQGDLDKKIETSEEEKQDINVVIRAGGKEISYSCDERCARVNNRAGKLAE